MTTILSDFHFRVVVTDAPSSVEARRQLRRQWLTALMGSPHFQHIERVLQFRTTPTAAGRTEISALHVFPEGL